MLFLDEIIQSNVILDLIGLNENLELTQAIGKSLKWSLINIAKIIKTFLILEGQQGDRFQLMLDLYKNFSKSIAIKNLNVVAIGEQIPENDNQFIEINKRYKGNQNEYTSLINDAFENSNNSNNTNNKPILNQSTPIVQVVIGYDSNSTPNNVLNALLKSLKSKKPVIVIEVSFLSK